MISYVFCTSGREVVSSLNSTNVLCYLVAPYVKLCLMRRVGRFFTTLADFGFFGVSAGFELRMDGGLR